MNKVEEEHPACKDPVSWWHRCSGSGLLPRAGDRGTLWGTGSEVGAGLG